MLDPIRIIEKIIPASKLPDVILGGQDGLVNTFGVILGVAAASGDIHVVIAGGLAACIAESISMGAVAYTSQRAQHDHYIAEREREKKSIDDSSQKSDERIRKVYQEKGFTGKSLEQIVGLITSNKQAFLSTLMSEDRKLSPLETRDVLIGSLVVFLASFVGAIIPLFPFFFLNLKLGIIMSFIFSAITLFAFGYYKGKLTVGRPVYNGVELLIIGMTAALLGYGIGYIFSL